mmetsp:Transcript_19794/g.22969  ORF Transcript_19794/g.22969 Transcript_19794/m.22969 type:complete len:88 (+) Transcript_19794:127-390(+)
MKKLTEREGGRKKVNDILSLLYKYSHKKFNDFIETPEVSVVIMMMFEKSPVDEFVQHHQVLNTNRDEYSTHILEVFGQMQTFMQPEN